MRVARTAVASLIAGALALSLVAAETAPTTPEGSATTRLLGAQLKVTGPLETPVVRVLDIATSATTKGTPSANTAVVPIALSDGTTVGESSASSDGDTSDSSDGGDLTGLGGALGITVLPIESSATATADRALATVAAATGELSALLGTLGLDLDTTGVTSLVSPDGAAATQGMQVSNLSLALGDLGLDAALLQTLGLENILALLETLPGILPADLADVSALFDDLDALETALADLDAASTSLADPIGDLGLIDGALPEIEALDTLLTTLNSLLALDPADLLLALQDPTLAGDLDAVGCTLDALTLVNVEQALTDAIACVTDALETERQLLVDGGVDGLDGVAPEDLLATVTSIQTALVGALPAELDAVVAALETVTGLVGEIVAALGDLQGLLGQLPDLLADAANLSLLDIGAFDVGTTAIAADNVANSSATVLCDAVDVTVLGETFATPDCSEALDSLPNVTGAISAAVGELTGILNALPLGDLVQVGELRADLFTDVVETVTEADGVVTSTAGFNLLDLAIPTVTIDPSQVTSTLDGLGLPVGLDDLDGVLAGLTDQLAVLDGLGLGVDVTDVTGAIGDASGLDLAALDTLVTDITGVADGLGLGTLTESVSTPGLELLIDPVSTASFQAAADGTAAPAPTPTEPTAPAPAPQPTLPSTGGGLALLGVLALAGAGSLHRRR